MPLKKMFQKHDPTAKKQGPTTQLKIRYNVGFPNNLFIRGEGGGLSWDKGLPLKNIREDEWLWETNEIFPACHFKILINDTQYEQGENHELRCGSTVEITPHF